MSSSKVTKHDLDKSVQINQVKITLPSSNWQGSEVPYTQTVSVSDATETNVLICAANPVLDNIEAVSDCKVMVTEQSVGTVTFTAFDGLPAIDLTFNLMVGGE